MTVIHFSHLELLMLVINFFCIFKENDSELSFFFKIDKLLDKFKCELLYFLQKLEISHQFLVIC